MPTINGILGQLNPLISNSGINSTQQSGIDQLKANASNGNPFASQIGGVANNLLSGGGATGQAGNIAGTLDDLKARLGSYANGLQIGNNPGLKAQLDQAGSDTANNINGSFAAAGRDFSGYNQNAVARGVTAAQAPIIANQYNQDVANQISAAGTLYGAGNTTAGMQSGLAQQGLANQQAGISAAGAANDANNYGANSLISAGTLQQQLPAQALSLLAQIGLPIAGLGGTATGSTSQNGNSTATANGTSKINATGTSTTTKQPSLMETMQGWGDVFNSFFPKGK
ncbi:tail fiber domain-containing protein [Tardiphaga sp. vice304]|uniref:tail fiber domain-containing protein n=1 Tax=Tardiphaga sp. vice304 TaxID=2592817 RepID=UPI001165B762|nr:tail fiber domain-containing protein [Tardiphaga sp. vice304]QDM27508.1 tail fiber domain-containing protein [Tardiphaga sp. vice304]